MSAQTPPPQAALFEQELLPLFEVKPPVSASKMGSLVKAALKYPKLYKYTVNSIEKFLAKASKYHKLSGLYIIDAIAKASKKGLQEADAALIISRFEAKLPLMGKALLSADVKDHPRIKRVLSLWRKDGIFGKDVLDALESLPFSDEVEPDQIDVKKKKRSTSGSEESIASSTVSQNDTAASPLQLKEKATTVSTPTTSIAKSSTTPSSTSSLSASKSSSSLQPETTAPNPTMSNEAALLAHLTTVAATLGSTPLEILTLIQNSGLLEPLLQNGGTLDATAIAQLTILSTLMQNPGVSLPAVGGAGSTDTSGATTANTPSESKMHGPKLDNKNESPAKKLHVIADFDYGDDDDIPKPPPSTIIAPFAASESTPTVAPSISHEPKLTSHPASPHPPAATPSVTQRIGSPPYCEPPFKSSDTPDDCIKVLSRTLYVGGVQETLSQERLFQAFKEVAQIESCSVNYKKFNAFVKFKTRMEASKARDAMNWKEIDGSKLKVCWGCGFGPKDKFDYDNGETLIPLREMTENDKRLMTRSTRGGGPLIGGTVVEEPNVFTGLGTSVNGGSHPSSINHQSAMSPTNSIHPSRMGSISSPAVQGSTTGYGSIPTAGFLPSQPPPPGVLPLQPPPPGVLPLQPPPPGVLPLQPPPPGVLPLQPPPPPSLSSQSFSHSGIPQTRVSNVLTPSQGFVNPERASLIMQGSQSGGKDGGPGRDRSHEGVEASGGPMQSHGFHGLWSGEPGSKHEGAGPPKKKSRWDR